MRLARLGQGNRDRADIGLVSQGRPPSAAGLNGESGAAPPAGRPAGAVRGTGGRALYLSGFVPAIQMITRLNRPLASTSKKLQLCISFFVPSTSSPM